MSLTRHLERQRIALTQLIDILKLEQNELTQNEVDGQKLIELSKQKNAVIENLNVLENQRSAGQKNLGYGEDSEGARSAAKDADCENQWDQLLEMASQAKQMNAVISSIIKMRMEQNQKMVSFLQEVSGGVIYGRDGKSKNKKLGGVSAKA